MSQKNQNPQNKNPQLNNNNNANQEKPKSASAKQQKQAQPQQVQPKQQPQQNKPQQQQAQPKQQPQQIQQQQQSQQPQQQQDNQQPSKKKRNKAKKTQQPQVDGGNQNDNDNNNNNNTNTNGTEQSQLDSKNLNSDISQDENQNTNNTQDPPVHTPPPAPKPKPVLEEGYGVVKAVPSGDTVVLSVVNNNNHSNLQIEKELVLSSLTAPRIIRSEANLSANTNEEPFAWESREFLRNKVLGKLVLYQVENKNPKTGREYGLIFLNEENLSKQIAAEGWAKVFKPAKEPKGLLLELVQLSRVAEESGKGLFQKEISLREKSTRRIATKFDSIELYDKLRRMKSIGAFVEQVRNGSQLRVWVIDENKGNRLYYNISVRVAGIQCPIFKFTNSGNNNNNNSGVEESFYAAAKAFTEKAVLHQFVEIQLQRMDSNDLFTAKVISKENGANLSELLLKEGLAHYIDVHAPPADSQNMILLEQFAKENKLNIWEKYVVGSTPVIAHSSSSMNSPSSNISGSGEFIGKVREIISNTLIVVDDLSVIPPIRKQINLASITPFRMDEKDDDNIREHLRYSGREFLRSKLIGQKVRVSLDYSRQQTNPKDQSSENRSYYSVFLDKTNVSKMLVERGLVSVVQHRQNEKRSQAYESLLIAEKTAQKQGKGKYGKDFPIHRVTDLATTTKSTKEQQELQKKARQYLPFLKRAPGEKLLCVVDRVHSPSKFKIFVPKESLSINFVLQGLKTPQRRQDQNITEPFSEESLEFTRDLCLQRDAEIEIDDMDKYGNFTGSLYINKKNFGVTLVESGFASLRPGNVRPSSYNELLEAEVNAKKQRKNIWSDWNEELEGEKKKKQQQEENERRSQDTQNKKKEVVSIIVTEILDGGHFFVQIKSEEVQQLDLLMGRIQEDQSIAANFKPKVKEFCLARFSMDGLWYRARVKDVINSDPPQLDVLYIDYGNSETVDLSSVKPIDASFLKLPPQAKECILANIRVPRLSQEFGRDAASYFRGLVWDKTMWASIESRDHDGKMHLSLGDPQSHIHVNAALLRAGLARLNKNSEHSNSQHIIKLREEEEYAKKEHVNLWQYGDISDDEDDDEPQKGRHKSRGGKSAR